MTMSALQTHACVEHTGMETAKIAVRLVKDCVKSREWHCVRTKYIGVRKLKTTLKKNFLLQTSFIRRKNVVNTHVFLIYVLVLGDFLC